MRDAPESPDAQRPLRRQVWLLSGVSFFADVSGEMVSPLLPFFLPMGAPRGPARPAPPDARRSGYNAAMSNAAGNVSPLADLLAAGEDARLELVDGSLSTVETSGEHADAQAGVLTSVRARYHRGDRDRLLGDSSGFGAWRGEGEGEQDGGREHGRLRGWTSGG